MTELPTLLAEKAIHERESQSPLTAELVRALYFRRTRNLDFATRMEAQFTANNLAAQNK